MSEYEEQTLKYLSRLSYATTTLNDHLASIRTRLTFIAIGVFMLVSSLALIGLK